jgi:hypothetical protein
MSNEKALNNTPEQQPQTTPTPENMSPHDEMLANIDNELEKLGAGSSANKDALANTEIDRIGTDKVVKNSSFIEKTKFAFTFGEKHKSQEVKMGKNVANQNLEILKATKGAELIELKNRIIKEEAAMKVDLADTAELVSPEVLAAIQLTLENELNELRADRDNKEAALSNEVAEHPAFKKQEELNEVFGQYSHIDQIITQQCSQLNGQITTFSKKIETLTGSLAGTDQFRKLLQSKLDELETQRNQILERGKKVKLELEELKKSKKDLDPYVDSLKKIGKTELEIAEERRQKQAAEQAKKTGQTQPATTGGPAAAPQPEATPAKQPAPQPEKAPQPSAEDLEKLFQEALGNKQTLDKWVIKVASGNHREFRNLTEAAQKNPDLKNRLGVEIDGNYMIGIMARLLQRDQPGLKEDKARERSTEIMKEILLAPHK